MAVIVWFVAKRSIKLGIMELILISFLAVVVISIEGGIISALLFETLNFQDKTQSKFYIFALINQNVSLIFASIVGRIPMNLIDKSISVFAGFLVYKVINIKRDSKQSSE